MPRVFRLVAAVLVVDTAFYAAIVPLLPHYVDDLGLSQTQAGILTASYAAGTLLGAIPAGMLVGRIGVRRGLLVGLASLGASSIAFGLAGETWLLIAARFVQGLGGACTWSAGFAWLIGEAPPSRRGELIGAAVAAAIIGVMLGPILGAAAVELGEEPVFSAVAVAAAALAGWALRVPAPEITGAGLGGLLRARRGPMVMIALWLVTLPAIFTGAIEVLIPLHLDELGAGAVAIGAAFLVAAAGEGVLSPIVGRVSDRRGRLAPIRVGLAASAAIGIVLPLVDVQWLLLGGTVAIVAALALFWAPGFALLSDATEEAGLDPGLGASLMNLTWAGGMVVGGAIGGAVADVAGDGTAYALLVAACVGTLAFTLARGRRRAADKAPAI
jgi:MFS family permease